MLRIRRLEWWGAWIGLFLQSGAVLPLVLAPEGYFTGSARLILQMLNPPVLLFSLVTLARRPEQVLTVVRRNADLALLMALPILSSTWSISITNTVTSSAALLTSVLFATSLAVMFDPRKLLLLLASVIAPIILLSLVFAVALPSLGWTPGSTEMRGVFTHKNPLGWCAAISSVISSILILDVSYRRRGLGLILLPASLVCLALSNSMTGSLSISAAILFTLFYRSLARCSPLGRVVLVLAFLQTSALVAILLYEFLVPLLEMMERDATLTGRIPLWHLVDREIADRLLLGYGYEAFWTDGNPAAWRIWGALRWKSPHAHSGLREIMLAFGLLGLPVYAWVLIRSFLQGTALYCRAPEQGWLWMNVFLGMFAIINTTESLALMPGFYTVLLTGTVVSFSLGHRLRSPQERSLGSLDRAGVMG